MKPVIYGLLILLFAAFLRIYGVNWDQNQHLHPDERFLTMVATAAKVPETFSAYLDPAISTLNPYNIGHSFYVYGTLPITLNKLVVQGTRYDSYTHIVLAGRYMSAAFDLGTLLLVIAIAHLLTKQYKQDKRLPYMSGFLYAIAVLPIQNAHFFTVDSFLTFFITLSVACALRARFGQSVLFMSLGGVAFGFAMATKISALYALPLILGVGLISAIGQLRIMPRTLRLQNLLGWILGLCLFIVCAYSTLRLGDPHMFTSAAFTDITISPQFKQNIEQLKSYATPSLGLPPSVQWINKKPLLFPLQNMAIFGLGIIYFLFSLIGLGRMSTSKKPQLIFITLWVFGFFIYQGTRGVTSMRYFYPMYPYMALAAGIGLLYVMSYVDRNYKKPVFIILMALVLIWPLSFMAIYSRPHSRVTASEWIVQNVPSGSRIATEYWDDWLPLNLPNAPQRNYEGISLPVFNPDTPEKWIQLTRDLNRTDYYILTSNRGYGSIMPIPDHYPRMSAYYERLFAGDAGFEKVAEFTSYPTLNLGFVKLYFDDQWSEEAFTVYDHPKVTIFKRK